MRAASIKKHSIDTDAPPGATNTADVISMEEAKLDHQIFGELYDLYYEKILNYLYRRTLNIAIAEDLTSNTFFKALRGLDKYRDTGAFGAWVFRIATNEIRMHWRSQHGSDKGASRNQADLRRIYFATHETQTQDDVETKVQRFAELKEALNALPQRYQGALALKYFEGFSNNEIAEILQKKLSTTKSLIHRGLKHLRREIQRRDATFRPDSHLQKRRQVKNHEKQR